MLVSSSLNQVTLLHLWWPTDSRRHLEYNFHIVKGIAVFTWFFCDCLLWGNLWPCCEDIQAAVLERNPAKEPTGPRCLVNHKEETLFLYPAKNVFRNFNGVTAKHPCEPGSPTLGAPMEEGTRLQATSYRVSSVKTKENYAWHHCFCWSRSHA